MTGEGVKDLFNERINEQYTNLWLDDQLNRFVYTATSEETEELVKQFQGNTTDSNKIVPLIEPVTISNPVNNIVDISVTSTALPNYKQVVYMDNFVFTVNGASKSNIQPARMVIYNQQSGIFSRGTYRYPKYELSASQLTILPTNLPCTSVKIWYIREPIIIDVSDAVTQIPYNMAMINLIVSKMIVIAMRSIRAFEFSQIEQQDTNTQL